MVVGDEEVIRDLAGMVKPDDGAHGGELGQYSGRS